MNTKTVRRLAELLNTTPGEVMEGFRLRRLDMAAMKESDEKFELLAAA
jgi:hypothetical protein